MRSYIKLPSPFVLFERTGMLNYYWYIWHHSANTWCCWRSCWLVWCQICL